MTSESSFNLPEGAPAALRDQARRILVLLPCREFSEPALAHSLWALASGRQIPVRVVAGLDDWSSEPRVALRLALLFALLRENGISVTSEYVYSDDWVEIARKAYLPGDIVACFPEFTLPDSANPVSARMRPLSSFLTALRFPVAELPRVLIGRDERPLSVRVVKLYVLPITIAVVSTLAQVVLIRDTPGWAEWQRTAAMLGSALFELISIAYLIG